MKTIAVITDVAFWRADRGDCRRIDALVRYLEVRFRVAVCFVGELSGADRETLAVRQQCWVRLATVVADRRETGRGVTRPSLGMRVRRWLQPHRLGSRGWMVGDEEPRLETFRSAAVEHAVTRFCREVNPDIVLVEYIRLAYLLPAGRGATGSACRWVIDTLDVMSSRYLQFQRAGERHWVRINAAEEGEVLSRFDAILAIQDEERETLQALAPGRPVLTVGHAEPLVDRVERASGDVRVLFVGSGGAPNRRALRQFLDDVWPGVGAGSAVPALLTIAGDVGRSMTGCDVPAGVNVVGHVDAMDGLYAETDIVVNPVTFGGGLKIKNVEALCRGMPLVTSPVGAQGLRDGVGQAFLVADDADSMTKALCGLMRDAGLRRSLSGAAQAYAARKFSEASAYGALAKWMLEEESEE